MSVISFEGIIENGLIKIPQTLNVPNHTKVYIIVPDYNVKRQAKISSPRLVHPEQANDFKKTVSEVK